MDPTVITRCAACGVERRIDASTMYRTDDWMLLSTGGQFLSLCSWSCLHRYAADREWETLKVSGELMEESV